MTFVRKFLCISVFLMASFLCCEAATISRPFANDLYPPLPTEILHMRPLQIYPQSRNLKYFNKNEKHPDEDKVIYVKLMKVNYRPHHTKSIDDFDAPAAKESSNKDIFYVKALTNGQFSDSRLKVFRMPEFYAINVYKKNNVI